MSEQEPPHATAPRIVRKIGVAYLAIVLGYVGIVLLQDWIFWRGSDDDKVAIVFDGGMLKEAGITCPGAVVLRDDDGTARYRCSTSGLAIGAFDLKRPIIPWPWYQDGESRELMGLIRATMANAEHIPPSSPTPSK